MFTGEGFSLNLGFRNLLCSHGMDSVLFQVSQQFCGHQRILYLQSFLLNFSALARHVSPPPLPQYACTSVRMSPSKKVFFCYRCFYQHWARDSVSPVCRIFFLLHRVFFCSLNFEFQCYNVAQLCSRMQVHPAVGWFPKNRNKMKNNENIKIKKIKYI